MYVLSGGLRIVYVEVMPGTEPGQSLPIMFVDTLRIVHHRPLFVVAEISQALAAFGAAGGLWPEREQRRRRATSANSKHKKPFARAERRTFLFVRRRDRYLRVA